MQSEDSKEANKIIQTLLDDLSTCISQKGQSGIDARTAIGDLKIQALVLLSQDAIGPQLLNCFDLVVQAGALRTQIDWVRMRLSTIPVPVTVGATMVQNSCIALCLATEADIIGAMTFTSFQDVETVIDSLQEPFQDAIESAADEMDQATYQALLSLASTLVNFLVTTARPLPRMINYQFTDTLPSLVIAHRLYADSSRADEIRQENKIVHPAFCPRQGRALSS
jgi:prophage DNA circulation protein